MTLCHKDLPQRLLLFDDYVVFVVVVVVAVRVATAEFDVVVFADVDDAVFHLVVLVLFVVAAAASDFEIDDSDFAVRWYFFEKFLLIIFVTLMMLLNLLFPGYI